MARTQIFVNDDGMVMRYGAKDTGLESFYTSNDISLVKHNASGFVDARKFEEACNIDYVLDCSARNNAICQILEKLLKSGSKMSAKEETEQYQQAIADVFEDDPGTSLEGDSGSGMQDVAEDFDQCRYIRFRCGSNVCEDSNDLNAVGRLPSTGRGLQSSPSGACWQPRCQNS